MITLTVAVSALALKYGELAYVSGWCHPWMTTLAEHETQQVVNDVPMLATAYQEGREQSNIDPLDAQTCERMLSDVQREIQALRND